MKKIIYISALLFAVMLLPSEGNAIPKIDGGNAAKNAVTSVTNFADNAKKKYDEISNSTLIKTIGNGIDEAKGMYKKYEEYKAKAEAFREDPLQASLNLIEEQAQKEQEKKGTKDENGDNSSETSEETDGFFTKLNEKVNTVKEATDLQQQEENLLKNINEAKDAKRTEVESKVKVLEENNAQLEQEIEDNPSRKEELTKQIEKNNAKIKAYQAGLEASEQEITAEDVAKLTDVQGALKNMQDKAEAWANEQTQKVKEELLSKLNSMNPEEDLKQNTENNFLANNEVEDAGNIIAKRNYRKQEAGTTAIETVAQVATIKRELDDDKTFTQNIASRTGATDGSLPANITDTQATIAVVQELAKTIELKIMDLKLKTASEMAQFEKTSSEPDSDITKFSLDKYICDGQNSGE